MLFMKIPAAVVLAVSATVLAACASGGGMNDQPFALFEADQFSVDPEIRPAFILEVDGEKWTIGQSYPVMPGARKLVVSVPAGSGVRLGYGGSRREAITIDAKACVRYYLAARRSPEAPRDWNVFISGTEPISGCRTKVAAQ